MRSGTFQHPAVRDTLLALLVVALTFLNLGHSSAVFAAGGRVVVTAHSLCGDSQPVGDGEHFACHACRIGDAAALPPPPAMVAPGGFAVAPVAYAGPVSETALLAPRNAAQPRAPPPA